MGDASGQLKAGAPRGRPRMDARDDPVMAGLRKLWSDVENEPVPEEFLALIDRIDGAAVDEPNDGAPRP